MGVLQNRMVRKRGRSDFAFAARRGVVEGIGLPEMRFFRLARLEQEERVWHALLAGHARVFPKLTVMAIARVTGANRNG